MHLTEEQERAVDSFEDVYRGRRRRVTLGGLAGTGKTTVIRTIVERYGADRVVVCTPTGKAAHVLRSKGVDHACTMHSLIYTPRTRRGVVDFVPKYLAERIPVAIVDEASMLSARLVKDFTAKAYAVLYVGDHGQLEPIGDDPGLMSRLDVRLERIHRQAKGSPIIQFAHHVRCGHEPKTFGPEASVQRGSSDDLADFDVVLCGYNATRLRINAWVRHRRGYSGSLPSVGEQVICLRNNKDWQVWNGMTGTVVAIDAARCRISVRTDDGLRNDLPFVASQFGAEKTVPYHTTIRGLQPTLWDFGYCLTAHRAQGSEWPRVAVKEEIASSWAAERWRYTAATRASQQLKWIV